MSPTDSTQELGGDPRGAHEHRLDRGPDQPSADSVPSDVLKAAQDLSVRRRTRRSSRVPSTRLPGIHSASEAARRRPGRPREVHRCPRPRFLNAYLATTCQDMSKPSPSASTLSKQLADRVSLDVDAHAGAAHHPTHGPTHPRRSSTPARRGRRPQRRWLRARGHQGPWRTAGAAPGHLPHAGPRRGAHSPRPVTSVTRKVPPGHTRQIHSDQRKHVAIPVRLLNTTPPGGGSRHSPGQRVGLGFVGVGPRGRRPRRVHGLRQRPGDLGRLRTRGRTTAAAEEVAMATIDK